MKPAMNPRVVSAMAISDTQVAVTFANGECGVLDVSRYLALPAFASIREPGAFRRAHVGHGTVVWSDEVDLCPDSVWAEAVRGPVSGIDI